MRFILALACVGALLAGCAVERPETRDERQTEPRTERRAESSANDAASGDVDEDESDGPTPIGQEVEADLPGLGATREAWEASRQPAEGYMEGSAYEPLVEGQQPRYAAVVGDDRIIAYTYVVLAGTSDSELLALLEAEELPRDAAQSVRLDCEEGPVYFYDSALLTSVIEGATGAYIAIERYEGSQHASAIVGVSFGDPSC